MTALLHAVNITKQFPGTLALDNIQLELQAGEIHAVMGENGAGKSTLMKILSGVYTADAGQVHFDGRLIAPANPYEALKLGIAIVHQELSDVPTLTVAENIFPRDLPTNFLGMVDTRRLYQNAQQVLEKMNVAVNPRALIENLSIANRQLIEITRALSSSCKVLILDEPTSALTDSETERLLTLLRRLADEGTGILYISHKLKEVFTIADRVTVLRDGRYIGTQNISDTTPSDVIRMMVGRELGTMYPPKSQQTGTPLLEARDIRLPGSNFSNSFTLNAGEILGFAGLIGSGRSELMRAIFGADPIAHGSIFLEGRKITTDSPRHAIDYGIGYLPEDRKTAGLFLEMSVKMNIEAAVLPEVSQGGFLMPSLESRLAQQYVQRLKISTPHIEQDVRRLSGGNQQKALLARWLAIHPRILIVDEPTRGIDVGARKEIHFLLRSLVESGIGVIMISSELLEILGMSDRILVMHEGAIVAEYAASEATEERIIRAASGQHAI
jgi:ribose transport system ATP-binding protein